MKVLSLVDESVKSGGGLLTEHGLALLIDFEGQKILFDTGSGRALLPNAKALGEDLAMVEYLVLSHGHFDHGGGLQSFLKVNKQAKVFLKKEAMGNFYSHGYFADRYIGLDKKVLKKYENRLELLKEPVEIGKDIFIVTEIKKTDPISDFNNNLMKEVNKTLLPDTFEHELFLIIKENGKLVIFTGCGHSGIANILRTTAEIFKGYTIRAIFGGFHYRRSGSNILNQSDKELVENEAQELSKFEVDHFYTAHCSGRDGSESLKNVLGKKVSALSAGDILEL